MLLLCGMMTLSPAHVNLSMDAKAGRVQRRDFVPALFRWQFIVLLLVVYIYASVAKWYPDWTSGRVTELMFGYKSNMPVLGTLYGWEYTPLLIAWGGILYDLLIIPMLLYKRTRMVAFWISIVFHLFNSISFGIGTFPYMMIGAMILFFPPEVVRKRFKMKANLGLIQYIEKPLRSQKLVTTSFVLFFVIQIALPLRHHIIPGNVYWTEEGHKLSWRMMLRIKSADIRFRILDENDKSIFHNPLEHLSHHQYRTMSTHPDMIWQYCQYLKTIYGENIRIYVINNLSLNGRKRQPFINPQVDMAKAKWHTFKHEDWIMPFNPEP